MMAATASATVPHDAGCEQFVRAHVSDVHDLQDNVKPDKGH